MLTLKKIAMLTAPALMIGGVVLLASSDAEAQTFEVHIEDLRHACSLGDGYACQELRWAVRQPRHVYMAPAPQVYRRYRRAYRPHRVRWQPRPRRMVHRRHVAPAPRHHRRHHATPAPRHNRRHQATPAPRHHRRGPAVHRAPRHRPAVHHAPRRQGGGNHARRGGRGGNGSRGRRGHI